MRHIFLDTSYLIALINRQDEHHDMAKAWAERLLAEQICSHLSVPIMFEIADGFARLGRREIGISLLEQISRAENYIVHPFRAATYRNAFALYLSRRDKEWSLTDCYSFELMKELELVDALTADRHFEQFGYHILLR